MGPDFVLRLAHSTVATHHMVVYDDNMEERMLDDKAKRQITSWGYVVFIDNT